MDIEGHEWAIFDSWPELADPGSAATVLPMQILVEVHYRYVPDSPMGSPRSMVDLQAHFLRMGYVVVERDDNQFCLHCTELTMLRTRCHESTGSGPAANNNNLRREN